MQSPQAVLEFSSQILTMLMHNTVWRFLPCPKDRDADTDPNLPTNPDFFTDLEVTEILPIRGDTAFLDAQKIFLNLSDLSDKTGNTTSIRTTENIQIRLQDGSTAEVKAPRTFLLVSLRLKPFCDSIDDPNDHKICPWDLHKKGSTDDEPVVSFQRTPSDDLLAFGALLFAVDVLAGPSASVALRFLNVFMRNPPDEITNQLQGQLGDLLSSIALPIPLDEITAALKIQGGIANAGMIAERWTVEDQPPKGVRIGFDLTPPASVNDWVSFFSGEARDLSGAENWAVAATHDFFVFLAKAAVAGIKPPDGISIGDPAAQFDSGKNSVGFDIPVLSQEGKLGDVALTLSPYVQAPYLGIKTCTGFNFDPELAVKVFVATSVVGTFAGGFIGGPWGLLVGAIVGGIAGAAADIGAQEFGEQKIHEIFGEQRLPDCTPIDGNGCRDCKIELDRHIPGVGTLVPSRVTITSNTVQIAGIVSPGIMLLRPAKLDVNFSRDWVHPTGPCNPPPLEPIRQLTLTNTGELPLRICEVLQHLTIGSPQPILGIHYGRTLGSKPSPLPIDKDDPPTLQGGSHLIATLQAKIAGNQQYAVGSTPPPVYLRILTNGGAWEVDVNSPTAPRVLDDATYEDLTAKAGIGCGSLLESVLQGQGPQWFYVDPVPFTNSDVVTEKFGVSLFGVAPGFSLQGFGAGGLSLGQAYSVAGEIRMELTQRLPMSSAHDVSTITIHLAAGVDGESLSPKATEFRGRTDAAPRFFATGSLSRWLYRAGPSVPLYSRVQGMASEGRTLFVLTEREIRVATVSTGSIRWTGRHATPHAIGFAHSGGQCAVLTRRGVIGFDPELVPTWRHRGRARAIALMGQTLFLADEFGISRMDACGDRLVTTSRIEMPGIEQLVGANGSVYARVQGWIWDVTSLPIDLNFNARRLCTMGTLPAAERRDKLVVFDKAGRTVAEYTMGAPLSLMNEWADVAVECKPNRGELMLLDKYETRVDPSRMPKTLAGV
jgi:hypothetical protein